MRTFLIAVFVLAGWLALQQPVPMIDPKTLAPPQDFVTIDGLSIHVVRQGSGERTPVLLIHGFGGWTADWQRTLPVLARRRAVYALDLPGWGLSDKPANRDYAIEAQAAFVLDFLDHFGLKRVDVVGNSMGGAIAVALAVTYPQRVRKLVLIDSAGYRDFGLRRWAGLAQLPLTAALVRAALPDYERLRRTLEWLYGDRTRLTPDTVNAHCLPLRTPGMAEALLAMTQTLRLDSVKALIPQITQSTLILWGGKDPLIPVAHARRFQRDIAGSQLHIFPGAGHVPQEEVPAQLNPVLLEFLNR